MADDTSTRAGSAPAGLPTPEPIVHPDSAAFWAATAEGRLLLQRCSSCDAVIWYPRALCPECGSQDISSFQASGRGTVYTWTRTFKGMFDYAGADPYVLAYVELEEGPRVMTNIVDTDDVHIGQQVQAVFHDAGNGAALVRFRPVAPDAA